MLKCVTQFSGCFEISSFICRCRHIISHYERSEITKLPSILCLQEEIAGAIKDILAGIKVQERGVFVQASTIGSLEALLEFLRTSKINVRWHIAVRHSNVVTIDL